MESTRKGNSTPSEELLIEEGLRIKRPEMYRVVLLNDDYTPRDFVVWVLMKIFRKSRELSTNIMQFTHTNGRGTVGVYPFDVAQTKVKQADQLSKEHEHPLKCILEVESGGEEQ